MLGLLLPDGWPREVLQDYPEAAAGLYTHRHLTGVPQGVGLRQGNQSAGFMAAIEYICRRRGRQGRHFLRVLNTHGCLK